MRRKMEDIAIAYKSHDSIANAVRLMGILKRRKNAKNNQRTPQKMQSRREMM